MRVSSAPRLASPHRSIARSLARSLDPPCMHACMYGTPRSFLSLRFRSRPLLAFCRPFPSPFPFPLSRPSFPAGRRKKQPTDRTWDIGPSITTVRFCCHACPPFLVCQLCSRTSLSFTSYAKHLSKTRSRNMPVVAAGNPVVVMVVMTNTSV